MRRLRALVADSDPDVLEIVSGAVEGLGADVVRAGTRQELIAALAAEAVYDFVVTDVAMPWLSGIDPDPQGPPPMVVLSAYRDLELDQQVHAIGDHVTLLYKPFSIEELSSALQSCLHDVLTGREA